MNDFEATRNLRPGNPERRSLSVQEEQLIAYLGPNYDMFAHGERKLKCIGSGGMGKVYEGTFTSGGRTERVAVKILSDFGGSEAVFLREVAALRRLMSYELQWGRPMRWVVEYRDFGLLATDAILGYDVPYVTMKLVEGKPIAALFGVLSTEQIDEIAWKLACAIHGLHAAGIIHRDIKPSNVLVTDDLDPVLLDLGIAKVRDGESCLLPEPEPDPSRVLLALDSVTTTAGAVLGTPAYMAPEQFRQRGTLGTWSDMHAFAKLVASLYAEADLYGEGSMEEIIREGTTGTPRVQLQQHRKLHEANRIHRQRMTYDNWKSPWRKRHPLMEIDLFELLKAMMLPECEIHARPAAYDVAGYFKRQMQCAR